MSICLELGKDIDQEIINGVLSSLYCNLKSKHKIFHSLSILNGKVKGYTCFIVYYITFAIEFNVLAIVSKDLSW